MIRKTTACITWTLEPSGEYSVRSAYNIQFEGQFRSLLPDHVWNIWAPARCKFFLWLLLLENRLSTADRLLLREWPNNYSAHFARETSRPPSTVVECPFSGRKSATGGNQKLVDISTKLFSKKISQRLKHIKKTFLLNQKWDCQVMPAVGPMVNNQHWRWLCQLGLGLVDWTCWWVLHSKCPSKLV